jgi:diaminohydroxyphosphoribosylaminopyrimidine deaminase/5-amino-6-(5-phosphoribosylamino)uracil reductase
MSLEQWTPFMQEAIAIAETGRFSTAPNPVVGAVLVKEGNIVARGAHTVFGGAHAEIECLRDAEKKGITPSECTLVVTLEPCAHYGKTPPCTESVIKAGIKHVVVGASDLNPLACGGVEVLRAAGVSVEPGVCEAACRDLIADFIIWQTTKRPFIFLKLASTLDGRIAARTGHSQWISSKESQDKTHDLRRGVALAGGAVFIGANTMLGDDPLLTARPKDKIVTRQPLAATVSSRLQDLARLTLFQTRPAATLVYCSERVSASSAAENLRSMGVRVEGIMPEKQHKNFLDLALVMDHLRSQGCFYVLCEGGGKVGLNLLENGLVDEFHLHMSPSIMGDHEAVPLFQGRKPLMLDQMLRLRIMRVEICGGDCHIILRPDQASCSQV